MFRCEVLFVFKAYQKRKIRRKGKRGEGKRRGRERKKAFFP